jgi:hypothetical protein
MRILMTIAAEPERDHLCKVATLVTCCAFHIGVLAQQRKRCSRVIEFLVCRASLPRHRSVATLATLLEKPSVRVGMTRTALLERQPRVFRCAVRHRMALLAGNIEMRARQRVTRLRVVESPLYLPVDGAVTPQAVVAKPPLVLVFVTRRARARQPEISLVQILGGKRRPLSRRNMRTVVALGAVQSYVLSVEFEACLRVVKGFGIPLNDLEIFSVMLRVTANAVAPCRRRRQDRCVIALARGDSRCDVLVAFQAAILRLAGPHLVTGNASRRAIPLAVRS